MLLAQNQSYSGIVKDLQVLLTTSPNYRANDGINEDKSICGVSQKVGGLKIMNSQHNEQIKILPYEANAKVRTTFNIL